MAPQQLRLGRLRDPTVLGVLAASLLITALVITGRWQDRTRHPPAPTAGPTAAADTPYRLDGGYRCPLRRPVLAMADGRSYPPGHPARPHSTPARSAATRPPRRRPPPATARRRCRPVRW